MYQKTVLPSGLRVVTEKIPGVRSAALGIWVTVGSRHETETENGISHFIEHMAFKGTESRSALEIARTIEQGGGMINAFTGKELTCFHVHVLDERLGEALDLLADILGHSQLDPTEIEKEKQVILDEIRDHADQPDDVVHESFLKALFAPHPLSRPILGPPENVRNFTREDLLRFTGSHYEPKRMVVAAAGHVSHVRLVRDVEEALIFRGRARRLSAPRIPRLKPKLLREKKPIQQAHMVIGTRGVSFADPERYALSVMNTVLGGGMSSRLFQNIRERHGIAYTVYSFAETLRDTGIWGVYLATDRNRLDRARSMVLHELEVMRKQPLTKAELVGVKTQLKGNTMLALENVSARMMRLARMEIYLGRYHTLDDVTRRIDAVTPSRVQTLARRLLREQTLVTAILEPKPRSAREGKQKSRER